MLLVASSKMLAKTHLVDSNFKKYGHSGNILLKQQQYYLSTMPKNQLDKNEFKVRILKLKNELNHEKHSEGISYLAHKYLDNVLDIIDEYRY